MDEKKARVLTKISEAGVVRFKGVDISSTMATAIDLVIKNMAGAKERVFRFDIK